MRLRGSFTVFISLVLVCTMLLFFTMAECVRVHEMSQAAKDYTAMAVESAFSEYNEYLWDNYRILGVDFGYGSETLGPEVMEKRIKDYASINSNPDGGMSFVRTEAIDCRVQSYSLLTDQQGYGAIYEGCKAVKENLVGNALDEIMQKEDEVKNLQSRDISEVAQSGKEALEDARAANEAKRKEYANDDDPATDPNAIEEPGSVEDNPLDAFEIISKAVGRAILDTLIAPDMDRNSYSCDSSKLPSHRTVLKGEGSSINDISPLDKGLYGQYVLEYLNYYGKEKITDGFKYEVEYLLAGKSDDESNLSDVAGKLLLMREAVNYQTIMSDSAMRNEARAIASVLAGFTGNGAIILGVELAIVAAWAYVESVLDVRLLLSGGKVALVKTRGQWTSDVNHLSSFLDVRAKAKECSGGMSYEAYLRGMLMLQTGKNLGMRSCDIFENALNTQEEYFYVRLDNMVYEAKVQMSYSGDELFLSVLSDGNRQLDGYILKASKNITY